MTVSKSLKPETHRRGMCEYMHVFTCNKEGKTCLYLKTLQVAYNSVVLPLPTIPSICPSWQTVFISDLFDSLSFMLREKKNLVIYTIQILAYSFISLTLWCVVFLPNIITSPSNTSLSSLLEEMDSRNYYGAINHKII